MPNPKHKPKRHGPSSAKKAAPLPSIKKLTKKTCSDISSVAATSCAVVGAAMTRLDKHANCRSTIDEKAVATLAAQLALAGIKLQVVSKAGALFYEVPV